MTVYFNIEFAHAGKLYLFTSHDNAVNDLDIIFRCGFQCSSFKFKKF